MKANSGRHRGVWRRTRTHDASSSLILLSSSAGSTGRVSTDMTLVVFDNFTRGHLFVTNISEELHGKRARGELPSLSASGTRCGSV